MPEPLGSIGFTQGGNFQLGEVEYRWNTWQADDGARLSLAIKKASVKRLMYRDLVKRPA